MIEELFTRLQKDQKTADLQARHWRDRSIGLAAQLDLLTRLQNDYEIIPKGTTDSSVSSALPCNPQSRSSGAPKQETPNAEKAQDIEPRPQAPEVSTLEK